MRIWFDLAHCRNEIRRVYKRLHAVNVYHLNVGQRHIIEERDKDGRIKIRLIDFCRSNLDARGDLLSREIARLELMLTANV